MGRLIRSKNWNNSVLGPPESWPDILKINLNTILNSGYPMFIWWGPDLIMFHNDAYIPVLGKKHPEALGKSARQQWAEIWDQVTPMVKTVFRGKQSNAKDLLMTLGRKGFLEETYWTFSYSPIMDEQGSVTGLFCACNEETEKIIRERRLKLLKGITEIGTTHSELEDVFEKAVRIFLEDPNDFPFILAYILEDDETTATLLKSSHTRNLKKSFLAPININKPEDDKWCFKEVLKRGTTKYLQDIHNIFSQGKQLTDLAVVMPIRKSDQGKLAGFFVAGISPQLELNEEYKNFHLLIASQLSNAAINTEIVRSEKKRLKALEELDKAKTVFFNNVSHEFRTPLTLMLGPLQEALSEAEKQAPEERERFILLHRNANRLLKLVNNLLDFSRIEAGKLHAVYRPIDISGLTKDIVISFASVTESAEVRYRIDIPQIRKKVYIDFEMWEKIVLNLLSNAYKYTQTGIIAVNLREKNNSVELTVSDTGTGIPDQELSRIFDRFHRVENFEARSFEGSGIGLALVKEFVKLHGGNISVQSVLGKGSTFTVSIPLGKSHLPKELIAPALEKSPKQTDAAVYMQEMSYKGTESQEPLPDVKQKYTGGYILIVDDNSDMRLYLNNILGRKYRVEMANDGIDALEKIKNEIPEIIITDIMMPRMDGFALLKEIKNNSSTDTIPVIMLSARAGEEARIEGISAGADDYLIKPFSTKELMALVEKNLSPVAREAKHRMKREREEMFELFHQLPFALAIINGTDHKVELVNETAILALGKSIEEVKGKSIDEVLPVLKGKDIDKILDKVLKTEVPFLMDEMEVKLTRDGQESLCYFNIQIQIYPNSEGPNTRLVIVGKDVTDRVKMNLALLEKDRVYRDLIQNLPVAVYTCDKEGYIRLYNEAAVQLWGRRPVIGEDKFTGARKMFYADGEIMLPEELPMARTLHSLKPVKGEEFIIETEGGIRRYIQPNPVPLFNEDGESSGALNVLLDITNQKLTEEALSKLAAIVESSEDAIISKTLEGIVTTWNSGAEKIFGYKAVEMIGQPITRIIPPSFMDEEKNILTSIRQNRKIEHYETKRVTKDGRMIDLSLSISPIKDNKGKIIGASKIARDITIQKNIQKMIVESEERFRLVADTAPVMIWMTDQEKACTFFNQGWFDFTGRSLEEELGNGWIKGIHPDDRVEALETYNNHFDEQSAFRIESRVLRHDGEYRWLSVYAKPFYDFNKSFKGYIGACVDITDQKEAKEELERRVTQRTMELQQKNLELEEQNKFVEAILNASIDVIAVFNKKFEFIALNQKGRQAFPSEVPINGKNLLDAFPQTKGTKLHSNLSRALEGTTVYDENQNLIIADRNFEVFYIPLNNYDGKIEEVLLVAHDITEKLETTNKLKEAYELLEKKNRELEHSNNELASFSYVASHDLQEPLRKIMIFGKMLYDQEQAQLSKTGKDFLMRMINASERMQSLIEALLEFSRTNTEAKEFETKDLNQVVSEVEKELRFAIEEKKAVILREVLPELSVIPVQFKQLLSNIISNSIKYAKEKVQPRIAITSQLIKGRDLKEKEAIPDADYCRITISDNGIGFEPEYSERIFELFQRLHGRHEYRGSGIGLAICKKIAKNHNGFLSAESEPGVGTSIHIAIPLAQP